ncbi:MAG: M20 family metallopeptidase [Eubacteriales bacterium]|nr:M20 family metallopeptidase [Eubacteriales bacterium]
MNNIYKWAIDNKDWLIAVRRKFHMYPELTGKEYNTNLLIRQYLDELNVSYTAPADNITIAVLDSTNKSDVVTAIRSDTDALAVNENTGLPFSSKNAGCMHACGHDAHITMGLGAAKYFKENPTSFLGTLKIIFQPAEEGGGGAQQVINTGLVNDVNAFFSLHVEPYLPTGKMSIKPGPNCAGTDRFKAMVYGVGGHAAHPDKCVDTVPALAEIISAFQTIVSRKVSPMDNCVLSICNVHAGNTWNVIAGEAKLEGTIRTFSDDTQQKITSLMQKMVENISAAHGCRGTLEVNNITIALINDEKLTNIGIDASKTFLGEDALINTPPAMIGDDFAMYRSIAPSCYGFLGVSSEESKNYPLHHQSFMLDENALPIGTAWLANCISIFSTKKEDLS